jgi:autotransporter family porin
MSRQISLLGCVVCAALLLSISTSQGAIATTGDIDPADPSSWTGSTTGIVGDSTDGTMNITSGSTVSNGYGYIGYGSGAVGEVTVDGSGSTWSNGGDLVIGDSGTGTLNITNGGAVSNTWGYIGYDPGTVGTVTVDGAGSTCTMSDYLYIGFSGTGTLNITNGGAVTISRGANIGYKADSVGTVTVDGADSTWGVSWDIMLGSIATGRGTLEISNGGAASNGGDGYIGYSVGSVCTAFVDGAGSTWTNTGYLCVGEEGTGMLNITNGGAVSSSGTAYLGRQSGSTGTVSVDGAGSTWANSGSLFVGNTGTGTLAISNGGLVSVGGSLTIDTNSGGSSFVDMSLGGQLALLGSANNRTDFLTLVGGGGEIRYWDGEAWSNITGAGGSDYSVVAMTGGDLDGYSVLTVTAVPEPATMSLLALGGLALLRRRKK